MNSMLLPHAFWYFNHWPPFGNLQGYKATTNRNPTKMPPYTVSSKTATENESLKVAEEEWSFGDMWESVSDWFMNLIHGINNESTLSALSLCVDFPLTYIFSLSSNSAEASILHLNRPPRHLRMASPTYVAHMVWQGRIPSRRRPYARCSDPSSQRCPNTEAQTYVHFLNSCLNHLLIVFIAFFY